MAQEKDTSSVPPAEHVADLTHFLKATYKDNKKLCYIAMGAMAGLGCMSSLMPVFTGLVVGSLQGAISVEAMTIVALGYIIAQTSLDSLWSFGRGFSNRINRIVCRKFGDKALEKNFERTLNIPAIEQKRISEEKLSEYMARASSNVQEVLDSSYWGVSSLVMGVVSSAIVFGISPIIGASIVAATVLKTGASMYATHRMKKSRDEVSNLRSEYVAKNRDAMANYSNINDADIKKEAVKQIAARNNEVTTKEVALMKKELWLQKGLSGFDTLMGLGIAIPAAYTALNGGDVGLYMVMTGSAYRMLASGSDVVNSIQSTQKSFNDYRATQKALSYDKSLAPVRGDKTLAKIRGEIEFKNVTFAYPGQEKPIFEDFNLKIKAGEKVALVGPSGMGKSTLAQLLKGDLKPQSGSISFDGVPTTDITDSSLKQQLSYLAQDSVFFKQESVHDNLTLFRPDATPEQVEEVLRHVNILDEMKEHKDGLNRSMTQLSKGQQQRLALARTFLRDAPIVVLDEPTSGLDVENQNAVLKGLKNMKSDKTVVFVSHLPAEIAIVDRAIVLDKGKIIEDGSPIQLMQNKDGHFRKMFLHYKEVFRASHKEKKAYQKQKNVSALPPNYRGGGR